MLERGNWKSLSAEVTTQMYRRMVFNIIARNQDDHVKNIAFLMDRRGKWSPAPAFDMTYSYQPDGQWTSMHQMSIHGKRDNFTMDDFIACGKSALL
jgi:serine/threonine-protein kinase HipA